MGESLFHRISKIAVYGASILAIAGSITFASPKPGLAGDGCTSSQLPPFMTKIFSSYSHSASKEYNFDPSLLFPNGAFRSVPLRSGAGFSLPEGLAHKLNHSCDVGAFVFSNDPDYVVLSMGDGRAMVFYDPGSYLVGEATSVKGQNVVTIVQEGKPFVAYSAIPEVQGKPMQVVKSEYSNQIVNFNITLATSSKEQREMLMKTLNEYGLAYEDDGYNLIISTRPEFYNQNLDKTKGMTYIPNIVFNLDGTIEIIFLTFTSPNIQVDVPPTNDFKAPGWKQ